MYSRLLSCSDQIGTEQNMQHVKALLSATIVAVPI
jgi:hypothetical protein